MSLSTIASWASSLGERRVMPWAVFALALTTRLVLGFGVLDPRGAPVADELVYQKYAESIVERGEIALIPGQPHAERMPGYLAFVAAVRKVAGPDLLVPRLLQALIGAGSVVGIFLLARRVAGAGPALLAGVAASVDPFIIFYDFKIFSETFAIAAVVWTLWYFQRQGTSLTPKSAAIGALLTTVGIYCRPDVAVLFAAVATWVVLTIRPIKRAAAIVAILVVVPALALLPWIARNHRILGHFIPLTTNSGVILWQFNNEETLYDPQLRGYCYLWPGHPEARSFEFGPDPTRDERFSDVVGDEVGIDRRMKELVWQFWRDHASELPGYVLAKWGRVFAITPFFTHWPPIFIWISRIWYAALFGFGALGTVVLVARRAPLGLWASYLAWVFVRTAFFGMLFRYRLQIEPLLLIAASAGVYGLLDRSWITTRSRPAPA